jgi:Na+/phosphate symporter
MLTYLLPLILAAFVVGWIRRALCSPKIGPLGLLVSGLVTFFAGGLAETYLIPQNVALTLALGACLLLAPRGDARRVTAAHLGAALAGGVLALLVILVAPATTYRVGGSPADLWLASSAAIATGTLQILRLARYFPLTVLLCLALPGVLAAGPGPRRTASRWFWLTTAGVAITLPFCYFASFYAQNGNPPARSLIIPGAILIAYAVFVGYTFRDVLQRIPEPRRVIVAAAVALVPLGIAITTLPEQAVAAQHAALWDAEDQLIRASRDAGQADVVVQPLPRYLGEDFVTPDRDNWFNVCVARYYGLRSIAATSS